MSKKTKKKTVPKRKSKSKKKKKTVLKKSAARKKKKRKYTKPVPGRKPGQPTKYRKEYCQMLMEHMKEGLSFETFGITLENPVHRDTCYEWAKVHSDFSDAKKKATDMALNFFEKMGRFSFLFSCSWLPLSYNTILWNLG